MTNCQSCVQGLIWSLYRCLRNYIYRSPLRLMYRSPLLLLSVDVNEYVKDSEKDYFHHRMRLVQIVLLWGQAISVLRVTIVFPSASVVVDSIG